jgi:hypothetical protein
MTLIFTSKQLKSYLLVLGLFIGLNSTAATYYSLATGDWNDGTKWETSIGGGVAGTFPQAGDAVVIWRGNTITVKNNRSEACASILIADSSDASNYGGGTLTFESGGTPTLTVTGNIQVTSDNGHQLGTIILVDGTVLTCGGITQGLGGGSTSFTTQFGLVTFTGSSNLPDNIHAFNNLVINGSGGDNTTINNTLSILGDLTITSGSLSVPAAQIHGPNDFATGILTVASGAKLRIGGNNNFPDGFNSLSIDANSTIEYYGSGSGANGDQDIIGLVDINDVSYSYGNLIFTGNGVKTITSASNIVIRGTLTFDRYGAVMSDPDVKLDINGKVVEARGSIVNTQSNAIRGTSSSTLKIGNGLSTASNTLSFDLTTPGTTNLLGTLIINTTGTTTLGTNLFINTTTTYTKGILVSTSSELLTYNDGAGTTGGADNAHVSGPVKKIGNSSFDFPIGKSGKWARLGIDGFSPGNATDAYTAEYFKAGFGDYTVLTGVSNVSKNEYWTLSRDNGTSDINVTLHYESGTFSQITSNPSTTDLFVAHYDGSDWGAASILANRAVSGNTTAGSATANGVTGYSPIQFTFGSDNSQPLPIKLISFNATKNDKDIVLNWATATEINNDHFTLERSFDGISFNELTFIPGAINSWSIKNYAYTDRNAMAFGYNTIYYRLKQTDLDGTITYSNITSVTRDDKSSSINIFPNPSNGDFIISNSKNADLNLQFIDMNGSIVLSTLVHAGDLVKIEYGQLPVGIYTVRTLGLFEVSNQKFVISK